MKLPILALVVYAALPGAAHAETFVSGFNPRFGTAPSPARADNPDYRPIDRPRSTFDFNVDIGIGDDWDRRDRDRDRDRDRRRRDGGR